MFFTSKQASAVQATTLFDLNAAAIDGTPRPLKEFAGKVVLVVNVATY